MDRKKAADLLDNLVGMVEDNHGADYDTALKMGIEALSASGDGPEPVDDTISRQAAIDALHMHLMYRMGTDSNKKRLDDWINSLPSAQSEIIRCKDCKYSERWYRDKRRCFLWHETGIDVFEDGYCNYAERRADGSECGKENG